MKVKELVRYLNEFDQELELWSEGYGDDISGEEFPPRLTQNGLGNLVVLLPYFWQPRCPIVE